LHSGIGKEKIIILGDDIVGEFSYVWHKKELTYCRFDENKKIFLEPIERLDLANIKNHEEFSAILQDIFFKQTGVISPAIGQMWAADLFIAKERKLLVQENLSEKDKKILDEFEKSF